MRSRRMGLRENDKGASKVWTSRNGANLILGDASNSCAAIAGAQLSGYDISHIICVANGNTSRKLEERHATVLSQGAPPSARRRSRHTPESGTTWATSWSSPSSPATGSACAAEAAEDVAEVEVPPQPRAAEREVTTMTLPPSEVSSLTLPENVLPESLDLTEAEHTTLEGAEEAEPAWEWLTSSQEAASAALRRALDVKIQVYRIADQMQPDAVVDIESEWEEHLAGMARAVEECGAGVFRSSEQAEPEKVEAKRELSPRRDGLPNDLRVPITHAAEAVSKHGEAGEADAASTGSAEQAAQSDAENARGSKRAVLVHCEMGYNRSPTLVLAFLVLNGCTLREAYRHVLGGRSAVDPLPPFRQALKDFEFRLHNKNTIEKEDWYAMHISELVDVVERRAKPRGANIVESSSGSDTSEPENEQSDGHESLQKHCLDEAVRMRDASIRKLLQEVQ